MIIEKNSYPNRPLCYNVGGSSNVGTSVILSKVFLKIITEFEKLYINSPSLHQELYQKK